MDTVRFRPYQSNDYGDLVSMIKSLYREDPEGEPVSNHKIEKTLAVLANHPCRGAVYVFDDQEIKVIV